MGVMKGVMSHVRFVLEGEIPRDATGFFEQALNTRRFVPLHPEGEDTKSEGWVIPQKPFDDESPIHNGHFLFGDRLILAYREDSIVLPKAIIKTQLIKKMDEYEKKMGNPPSSQTRYQMQLSVVSELRRRVLPKTKIVEVVWDLSRKELRFFARGKSLLDRFTALFEQSFELRLRQRSYTEAAFSAQLDTRSMAILEQLKPAEIFIERQRVEVN